MIRFALLVKPLFSVGFLAVPSRQGLNRLVFKERLNNRQKNNNRS